MRLTLDTDVIVAALRSPSGASAELLRLARQKRMVLLASVPMFVEYEATCCRAEHLRASGLSMRQARHFLDGLAFLVEPVRIHYLWRPQLRDPADEIVLEAAVNGQADMLVSFNVRDFGAAPKKFDIELLVPREALRRLR